jgi:hypothetical protein
MDEREQRRIEPGMDVNDLDGKKLGTVVELRPHAGAPPGPGYPAGGELVEVKTGFLGLGKHLYIPLSAVREVLETGVFLTERRDELDTAAWEQAPEVSAPPAEVLAPQPEVSRPAAGPAGERPAADAAWAEVAPHYRSRWEEHYAQAGADWEAYEPRYRFAWEHGLRPELIDRGWFTAQPALREAWEAAGTGAPWEQVADSVRDAWEHPAAARA